MHIDIRTLALVLGITHIIQVLVFTHQYATNKTIRGVGWWLMWSAAEAAGFACMLLRGIPSIDAMAVFAQNALIVLGVFFLYIGIMRFLDRKENRRIVVSIFTVFLLSFFYFVWVDNDIQVRGILISAALVTVSFLSAQGLFVNKTPAITGSANFITAVFIAHGCYFALRAVMMLAGTAIDQYDAPTLFNAAGYMDALIVSILLTFGLIIMINQRLKAEISETKEHFELIFNTSPDASLIARLNDGIIANINDGFTALTGFPREETVGKSTLDIHLWKDPVDRQKILDELVQKGFCENLEVLFQRKDGSHIIGMMSAKLITLQGLPHIVSITRDITNRKQAEEALRESEARYRAVTHSATDGIITVDYAGNIVDWNRGAKKIFGYTESEICGQPVIRLIPSRYRDRHLAGMSRMQADEMPQVIDKNVELEGLRKDMSEVPIELSLAQWETAGVRFYTAILRDISERKQYQEDLEYLAIHDPLTGLLNRHSLEDILNRTIAKAKRGAMSSLLYMDLDNFKDVNDTVGHAAGDEVLINLSGFLKAEVRTEDVAFRLGGDEFAVLLDGIKLREALPAAERLRVFVEAHPFELHGRVFPLSLSIGIIEINGTLTMGELLSQADAAMYRAKEQGKNRVEVFR